MTAIKNQYLATRVFDDYNPPPDYNHFVSLTRLLAACALIPLLSACTAPGPTSPTLASDRPVLYVFRYDPPALVELSTEDRASREIPISLPAGCGLSGLFPPSHGAYLAMELSCAFGQTVLWADTDSGEVRQVYAGADSHFLAWTPDGEAVYLKVDSIGDPHIVRAGTDGLQDFIPVTGSIYDLAPQPDGPDFTFTFSRGMGFGSEMWLARRDGGIVKQLAADKGNYLSLARWSPDGSRIALIKIPDSSTPFPIGQLWVMNRDGSDLRFLASADAGHGFAPAWSPDGERLAFVGRDNPQDESADRSADALRSNIYLLDLATAGLTQVTHLQNARVEAPLWSPDGNTIGVTVVIDDKIKVYLADVFSGESRPIGPDSACCAVWIRK
jgi:Tol biopolymer transport system component